MVSRSRFCGGPPAIFRLLFFFYLSREKTSYLDNAILSLNDLDRISCDFKAGAGFRDISEMVEYQAVECLGVIQRQMQTQFSVQFAQGACAFQQHAAVFLAKEFSGLRRRLGREVADYFFQNVFQRDQTQQFAVFIHNQSQAGVAFLKLLQLLEQRRVGRDEIRFVQNVAQLCDIKLSVLNQGRHAFYMQDADDVAGRVGINRQQRMVAGRDLLEQDFRVGIDVQRLNQIAGDHYVVDRYAVKIDQVQQHFLVLTRQVMFCIQHQSAQFFQCHSMFALIGLNLDAHQTEEDFYDAASYCDHGVK